MILRNPKNENLNKNIVMRGLYLIALMFFNIKMQKVVTSLSKFPNSEIGGIYFF